MKWMGWSYGQLKGCPVHYVREIVRAIGDESQQLSRVHAEAEQE